jgi:chromosome segregation protein
MKTKISRITMQGFKSFSKRISVPLESGFNIFCGPNGVGKSNVVDAICFVLGRTSAKSMRAGRLHELIFHGGAGKSPAKLASVTMYLDNFKDGERPFNFDDDEISITRKVNRKGVSVYKLNGRTTTRDRILQVLSPVRIYPDGHNIILQGDITQIIEMNPVERRGIIDEISGIAEYNDKKGRAERDLEAVDHKLKEAEILISERYDRFKKLEVERNAAVKYQQLQKRLVVLRASLAHRKLVEFEDEVKKKDEEIEKKEGQNASLEDRIGKIENEIEEKESSVHDVANKLVDVSKRVKVEKEISDLRSQLLITKDKVDANNREIERLNGHIEKLEAFESRHVEMRGGVPRAVQSVLKLKVKGVYGTVADLIKVPEKYRTAIEVAAGSRLNNIVVDNDETAAYCIKFLKEERIGRATFLPLNKIKPRLFRDKGILDKKGVVDVASRMVKYDTKYMRVMEFVFGNTLIVDGINDARNVGIGKARMVTIDGDLIERSGVMVGGHYIRKHPKVIETEASKEVESYIKRRDELREELKVLRERVADIEGELKKLGESEPSKELLDLQKTRVASEREISELKDRRKRYYEKRLKAQSSINRLEVEKARLEAEMENAKIEVEQYGDIEYVDETVRSLEKFIAKAEKELKDIGLVNMKAIDEYELFRSQFDEYKKKYEKILEEKRSVLEMIDEIENKRREVFNRTLEKVSSQFSSVFSRMTGGKASLELENPTDIESGLIIQANPAGKRLLSIDAMSGGEKSITALAFIFAIQSHKPAPFYILDEVDAALDKENSKKVAELIKSLAKDEQFIMITHNEQTIKYGDRVYGVTMERGESKILGVEMPEK